MDSLGCFNTLHDTQEFSKFPFKFTTGPYQTKWDFWLISSIDIHQNSNHCHWINPFLFKSNHHFSCDMKCNTKKPLFVFYNNIYKYTKTLCKLTRFAFLQYSSFVKKTTHFLWKRQVHKSNKLYFFVIFYWILL